MKAQNNMEQFEKFSMLEHKDTITSADTPQMVFGEHQITVLEISDEEIEEASNEGWVALDSSRTDNWIRGAKWYRERLKQLNRE